MLTLIACTGARSEPGWPTYGGAPAGDRYSRARQIDRSNLDQLAVAWTYHTHALDTPSPANDKAAFEATPILLGDTLFLSSPFDHVIALDARTGQERWSYDPKIARDGLSEVTSRGVAAWTDGNAAAGRPCKRRIFIGTLDARLIALDATRGTPCADFGSRGMVDLSRDVKLRDRGDYQVTSPPTLVGDVVVVGSSVGDNRGTDLERGVVRGFDARSGQLRWAWDPIPRRPEDLAGSQWQPDDAAVTGAANAWGVFSADAARDLVFIPTGSAAPDFYGGHRRGDNRWANAVVALRGSTGALVWGFQVVHHDLWDYDVAAQPTLTTVKLRGVARPAVVVATKMGFLFVLDRDTGKPLFDVVEQAVPRSDTPGETASPTQPFPTRPEPLGPSVLAPAQVWGATPEQQRECQAALAAMSSHGLYTPPSIAGTLVWPGNAGGVAWGGVAVDPERHLLVVNSNRLATLVQLIPRHQYQAAHAGDRFRGEFARQLGTPFGMYRRTWVSAESQLPCTPPPWGVLTAVDLDSGKQLWQVPLGDARDLPQGAQLPPGPPTGLPSLGGALMTASGLVFIAAAMDTYLRAFDSESGRELWKAALPASAQATPMTYVLDGRQYVVIAAGGHGKLGTKQGDAVVAFALSPKRP